jgi:hypothetical protein
MRKEGNWNGGSKKLGRRRVDKGEGCMRVGFGVRVEGMLQRRGRRDLLGERRRGRVRSKG